MDRSSVPLAIEHEQAAILAAFDSEKELTRQAEAAHIEIDGKLAIAREHLAEATRLNDLSLKMQAEKKSWPRKKSWSQKRRRNCLCLSKEKHLQAPGPTD